MLGFSTDLQVPDDVGAIGVYVQSNDNVVLSQVTSAEKRADGTSVVRLPATLAVRSPKSGQTTVKVRVVAFDRAANPIVVKQSAATTPRERVALLRMPLLWVNRATLNGGNPVATRPAKAGGLRVQATVPSDDSLAAIVDCNGDATLTRVAGKCVPVEVIDGDDASALPEYEQESFFGRSTGTPLCFDTTFCSAGGTDAVVDNATCSFDTIAAAGAINVAVESNATDDSAPKGICNENGVCLVMLARGDEGVQVTSSPRGQQYVRVQLPRSICESGYKRVLVSQKCAPLQPDDLICNKSLEGYTPAAPRPTETPVDGGMMMSMDMDATVPIDAMTPRDGGNAGDGGGTNADGGAGSDGGIDRSPQDVGPSEFEVGTVVVRPNHIYSVGENFNAAGPKPFRLTKSALPHGTPDSFTIIHSNSVDSNPGNRKAFNVSVGNGTMGDLVAWSDPAPPPGGPTSGVGVENRAVDYNGMMVTVKSVDGPSQQLNVIGAAVTGWTMGPAYDGITFVVREGAGPYLTSLHTWNPAGPGMQAVTAFPAAGVPNDVLVIAPDPSRRGYPVVGTESGKVTRFEYVVGVGASAIELDTQPGKKITAIDVNGNDIYFVATGDMPGTGAVYHVTWDAMDKRTLATGLDLYCEYTLADAKLEHPCGIVSDVANVYVATKDGKILVIPRATTMPIVPPTLQGGESGIRGLAVDPDSNYLYWAIKRRQGEMMPSRGGLRRKYIGP